MFIISIQGICKFLHVDLFLKLEGDDECVGHSY